MKLSSIWFTMNPEQSGIRNNQESGIRNHRTITK